MKNIIKIILGTILVVSFVSCDKFLDIRPINNEIAIENTSGDSVYYKSVSEVESALEGAYADFRNEYFELDYFVNGDAQSDDAYAGADNPANFQIDEYNIDALNANVSRDWGYLYTTIGKSNLIINNVEAITDPELTEARKMEIKGEACFIRAFMYFQLVQLWGDVPLQIKDIKTFDIAILPDLFPPRSPIADIYSQIISDLEIAVQYVKPTASDKGYATKGAVNTLLAKVYATIEPHDWSKVNQYCDAVIAGPYSLLPDYDKLWDNSQENSDESIFEINYAGTSSSGNWGVNMFIGTDWKKFNIPSNDLVKAFEDEGDVIRKNSSIIYLDATGHYSDSHWPQTAYPYIHKYRAESQPSPQNYIFYRLADVLLLKAEALNETGDVTGAAALVNQVRNRVNLSNTSAATQDAMRLAIEKERRLELAFEGHRWFDLKRTGRAITVINSVTNFGGVSQSYNLTQERLLWPIPQAELDKSSALTQNPGY
jgi:starch-binding outer membrane protein, SusD/RagB family